MGNHVDMLDDTIPDPVTGLTPRGQKLIKNVWYLVVKKDTVRQNGTEFFLKLFSRYPYLQNYFTDFVDQDIDDLKLCTTLRAHGMAVFTVITAYMESLDDPDTLIELINKRTKTHYQLGVTPVEMENFKTVLLEYLDEKTKREKYRGEALLAWNKFLSFHNAVFTEGYKQLVAASAAKLPVDSGYV